VSAPSIAAGGDGGGFKVGAGGEVSMFNLPGAARA
jgi:hypothetical protein